MRGLGWLPFVVPRSWSPAVAADAGERRHTQDDVLASQEQNRWAVRSHWCFGTRTRIRRYERSTAFTYESDACDTEMDAAPVAIRI